MIATEVFKKILITEKTYKLMEKQQIVFLVDVRARKPQIKEAFEAVFGYKVASVNVLRKKPKPKRVGRFLGKTKRFKKAIITLAPGQKFGLLQQDSDLAKGSESLGDKPVEKKGIFSRFSEKLKKLTTIDVDAISKDKK